MNDFTPVCGFVAVAIIIGGVIAIVVAAAASRAEELNNTFSDLARHYGGKLHKGSWFERPSVTFNHRSNWVRVDIYSTGGKNPTHYTQVHMGWPEPGFRMEVKPEGFFHSVGKFLGMQDIEIGAPEFDRAYIISGNDLHMLRETLNPQSRQAIDSLRRLRGNNNVYVAVRNYELLVKKLGLIDDLHGLRQLTDLSLQLYDAAIAGQSKGIEFVDAHNLTPPEDAVCQICGDTITSDVVFCRSCETPHHRDCWQYYGQCSTFGCGQRRYRGPGKQSKSRRV